MPALQGRIKELKTRPQPLVQPVGLYSFLWEVQILVLSEEASARLVFKYPA